jgi:hypothetical protein
LPNIKRKRERKKEKRKRQREKDRDIGKEFGHMQGMGSPTSLVIILGPSNI